MRKNILSISLFALTILPHMAVAFDPAGKEEKDNLCPKVLVGIENVQIHQDGDTGGRCYLSISARDNFETLIYRSYLLTDDGLLMVFNSYGDFKSKDGARDYFFLTNEFKGFQWVLEGDYIKLTGFSDRILKINVQTAQIEFISDSNVRLDNTVSPQNNGGLEILNPQFLLVDSGFKLGGSPSAEKSNQSLITNSKNQTCRLKNSRIFNYIDGSAYLKPLNELGPLVKATCSSFDI